MDTAYKNICMMIHPGRVGSTVVAGRLSGLPIFLAGEIYISNVNGLPDWTAKFGFIELCEYMLKRSQHMASSAYQNSVQESQRSNTYLFEYKPFHPGCDFTIADAVCDFLDNGVTHLIFLYRKNYLRRYISYLVSMSSGVWHTPIQPHIPHRITVDINACSDWEIGFQNGSLLAAIDHYYNNFVPSVISAIHGNNHLILTYEDHVEQDPDVAFRLIKDFLGIGDDMAPVDGGYRKQNNFPLKDIIENYDQVAAILSSSGYDHLLI